jgi:hypothetical protein
MIARPCGEHPLLFLKEKKQKNFFPLRAVICSPQKYKSA